MLHAQLCYTISGLTKQCIRSNCAYCRHNQPEESRRYHWYFRSFNAYLSVVDGNRSLGALNVTLSEEDVKYLEEPYTPSNVLF